MRTTIITVACLALLSCGGSSPPRVDWPAVVACSEPAQAGLLSSVVQLLLDRAIDPSAELERFAVQHGPDVIACVINQAVTQLATVAAAPQARAFSAEQAAPAGAAEQSSAEVAASRGRDFLKRVGTQVVEGNDS